MTIVTLGTMFALDWKKELMAHQHPPRFLKIVDDAKTRVRETNVEQVKRKMDRGEKFMLVDVREESEFAKDICPAQFTWAKGSSSVTSRPACLILVRRLCFTAAADSARRWPPTICRRWATRT